MNYTRPNDEEYEDNPEDWLLGTLIYTKLLGYLLPVGRGVVVDLAGGHA